MTGRARVGIGFDAHPFGEGRPLRLGGIELEHPRGLKGHSDGDALLHAIADALLGAAGLDSLGEHFPDSDAAWRDVESSIFLARARELIAAQGFAIDCVDAVVLAEVPKIAPHREQIRARIAEVLGLPVDRVNVRGTSSNGLGFSGRGEGIAAMAVVLLEDVKRET